MKIPKKYKFKGWDWSELGYCWGIITENDSDKVCREAITNYICERMLPFTKEEKAERKKMIRDIRRFLKVLKVACDKVKYSGPIWAGLLEIKEEESFLDWTMKLLENMWS